MSKASQGPSVVGHTARRNAFAKTHQFAQLEFQAMVDVPFTIEEVYAMVFNKRVIDTCREAKVYTNIYSHSGSYMVGNHSVYLDFEDYMLPPRNNYVEDSVVSTPLHTVLTEAAKIYIKWAKVREVIRYLDQNGSRSAIQYYWPTFWLFVPGVERPSNAGKARPIKGVSDWLPYFRETANTAAAVQFLAGKTVENKQHLRLTIPTNKLVDSVGGQRLVDEGGYIGIV